MPIEVSNTHPDSPRVTLFGQLENGKFDAEIMNETDVPYDRYWDNAVDQVMVYLDPTEDELDRILRALSEGRLKFSDLQDYGSANGGVSRLPV
jgi:hypothetical protein